MFEASDVGAVGTLRQIASPLGSGLGLGSKRTHRLKIGNPQMKSQLSPKQEEKRKKEKHKTQNHLFIAEAGSRKLVCFHNARGIKTLGRRGASSCLKRAVDIKSDHSCSSVLTGADTQVSRRPLTLMARGQLTSDPQVLHLLCHTVAGGR